MDDSQIAYDERGLVPCVVQDWSSGEVLTVAYMNADALARTRETGEMHFFSRSRQELWHKGETSGNTQALRAMGRQAIVDRAFDWYLDQAHPSYATATRAQAGARV